MAAQALGAMVSMPIATRMSDKTGPGRVVLIGLTLIGIGMLSLTRIQSDTPLWFIECTLFVQGLGMGATMMPSVSAALSTLQRHEIASVSSGVNAMQRVGGSIGITLFAVVLSHQMTKIGVTAHSTETMTPSMLSALSRAFGHTFTWVLGITVLALAVASFLPRKKN
jgi:MFS family permease